LRASFLCQISLQRFGLEPMDAAVFPEWLECAHRVLRNNELGGYANADIKLSPE
jgi:hypothetical protein